MSMEPVFTQTVSVTDSHVDCFRRLKPSALLYLIQDISGNHAAQLGNSWEILAQKNLFWALIRHKIEITRLPVAGEEITLQTWPMPTTRVAYPRATVAFDQQGNELFRSVALWVLMDLTTRAMVLPGKSGVVVNGLLRGSELEIPPSILPKEMVNTTTHTVGYSLLDRNGHMNNTRYLDWTDDLLSSQFHADHPLKGVTLCYLSEAREGQQIHLHWNLDPCNVLCVDALRPDSEDTAKTHRVFAAQLEF